MRPKSNPLVSRPLASTAALCALAAFAIAGSASAATLLFSDNFNETSANEVASTFNDNLADTQGGSIGVKTYTIGNGSGNAVQHSNGGTQMTLASFGAPQSYGQVSLNHNFADNANAANQALQVTFNLLDVFGYANTSNWLSFTVGEAQNQFVTGLGAGIIFRRNGDVNTFGGTGGIGSWAAGDLVTITLSGLGGVGSAYSNLGSQATFKVGANTIGTFDFLDQRINAFLTFSANNNESDFGGGNVDNLSVTLIPEPSTALLGSLGLLALLRRRRA